MSTMVRANRELDNRQTESFVAPVASVTEDRDGYLLQMEMPGVSKEGLKITMEDNELTIVGRRWLPSIDGALLHRESRREDYRRSIEIDPSIDWNKINAKIEHGILTLTLPKAEHVKPRKITVS
ncbi:MAG TPA: Hsp20/alpha crystallin family protein [Chthoniobacterales bacterium]|nr:Hsp20/alpha crystallin family protein [Chthoniobacterales bacterium]